jgi:hypothetical protein
LLRHQTSPASSASSAIRAGHPLVLAAHLGHTVHMSKRRRVALSLSAYAGLNHWRSSDSVSYADEDLSGSAVVSRNLPVVGGELRLGYRFHRRVGAQLVLGAPAPTATSYTMRSDRSDRR